MQKNQILVGKYLLFIALLGGVFSYGQQRYVPDYRKSSENKLIRFGYYLGLNHTNFKTDYVEDRPEQLKMNPEYGFNVGLFVDLRLINHVNLRFEPGMFTTQRNITFPDSWPEATSTNLSRELKSTYIRLPLVFKFSALRLHNVRPYVIAGASTSINLSSKENSNEDNNSGEFRTMTQMHALELGLGVELYLPYFKFTPSIRGVFGLNDELVSDSWTSNIDGFKTRGVFLNFIFE